MHRAPGAAVFLALQTPDRYPARGLACHGQGDRGRAEGRRRVVVMRERFYTTAELARICGVSISTIKRWTDAGLLRCVRTPGGHRKFRLQDVAEAARRLDTSMALPEQQPAASADALSLLLLQRHPERAVAQVAAALAHGDEPGVCRWLTELHRHGSPVHEVAGEVLLGALDAVRAGTDDDFVRCRAARLAQAGAQRLTAQLPPPVAGAPRALLAAASEPTAALWLVLAALVLADAGWERVDLGYGVPAATIRAGLTAVQPQIVVLAAATKVPQAGVPAATVGAASEVLHECGKAGIPFCLFPGATSPGEALLALRQQVRQLRPAAAATPAAPYTRSSHVLP